MFFECEVCHDIISEEDIIDCFECKDVVCDKCILKIIFICEGEDDPNHLCGSCEIRLICNKHQEY